MHPSALRRLVYIGAATLALTSCSKKVESPKVTVTGITPALVCNDQRIDPNALVNLDGSGFTPMPTNVLAEPAILVLPEVEITKSQDLSGAAQTGTSITFPGEPGETLSNNLNWSSSGRMTLRVSEDPPVTLDPGLYDVKVTQPDGDHSVSVPQGLAVVPPPSIGSITPVPQAVCTSQGDRQLVMTGQNFLVVAGVKPTVTMTLDTADTDLDADQLELGDCSAVPGTFDGDALELCTTITVTLREGQLAPGAYAVRVTSPEPASCVSSEAHTVVIVPPPVISDIVPPAICVDQTDQTITVNGGNFARITVGDNAGAIPTVTIASADGSEENVYEPVLLDSTCAPPAGVDAGFGVDLCDTLSFTVPVGDLPIGDYTVTITNPDPIGCASADVIDLTVNAPPEVTGVAPATVCSGGSILRLTGTGFQDGATASLVCAATTLSGTVSVIDATSADVTFGPGITAGETCDVVFQNADGCEDRPLPHQSVVGTEGPILFNVDPHVAFDGINTKVTLYVTSLDGSFDVQMWPDGDTASAVALTSVLAPGKTTVIQATIPSGTAVGSYTLSVNDQSGCMASLESAVTVTDTTVVNSGTLTPPFGRDSEATAITISLGSDPGTTGVPRAFLNPPGDEPAIQLQSVTVVDTTTLTAVVPSGTPVESYDLVVVWPDGSVAVLSGAYDSISAAPPVVTNVSPQSIIAQAGQTLTIDGTGFSGSGVTVDCQTSGGAIVSLNTTDQTEVCAAGACTQQATVDASSAGQGAACVVRVTNTDGSYGEYSAVATTNSSLNLAVSPTAGTPLNTGRRALVAAGVAASTAARYVYAIGGDDGAVANAFDSVEFAAVDVFGNLNPWLDSAESLGAARAFAGSTTVGRYIYVVGGNDGSGSLASAERALVLSPDEIPALANIDLCLSGGSADCFGVAGLAEGLDAGVYSYRVAALIDASDPVNLGGETLASDPIILRLRNIQGRKVTVSLDWTAPLDAEGTELSGITGYRIYRTPMDGDPGSDEALLAEVDASTLSLIDDGSVALGTDAPRPVGSTSSWQALPALGVAREGLGVTAAVDPADATTHYVYALLGANGGTGHTSYEYLPVTLATNGRQTVAASWTTGAQASAGARVNYGLWKVDDQVSVLSGGTTYLYLGSGSTVAGATTGRTEVATVSAGGELSAFNDGGVDDPNGQGQRNAYGAVAVGSQVSIKLFMFGGRTGAGAADARAFGGEITALPAVGWNAEGGFSMTSPRALLGTTVLSANVFMIGGTSTGTNALGSTEKVVW